MWLETKRHPRNPVLHHFHSNPIPLAISGLLFQLHTLVFALVLHYLVASRILPKGFLEAWSWSIFFWYGGIALCIGVGSDF